MPKTGTVSVTFEEPASGKTIKWYKLLWNNNGGHTQERNELWKSIFSSAKESFSDDDIAYYTTYLGEDYIQEESNTSTVITDISSSSGTDARYIRQFVGN